MRNGGEQVRTCIDKLLVMVAMLAVVMVRVVMVVDMSYRWIDNGLIGTHSEQLIATLADIASIVQAEICARAA